MGSNNKFVRIGLIILLFLALVGVRVVGKSVFYDPLIEYFKAADYSNHSIPSINQLTYYFHLCIRYIINSSISVLIIYLFFQKKEMLKLSALVFGFGLILSLGILSYQLNTEHTNFILLLFARRIIMHPVIVLILLPAFYFQMKQEKNTNAEEIQ